VEVNEVGRLTHVVVKHPLDAFIDEETIATQWQELNFATSPDLDQAIAEYERLVTAIRSVGAEVSFLPRAPHTTLDSLYVRDASSSRRAG
jgi:N-dimethylarginine dimethylaminohydrolase